MPQALTWTPEDDATIERMRMAGARWRDIAAALGLSETTICHRARTTGIQRRCAEAARLAKQSQPPIEDMGHDAGWAPPAGHPIAWAILNAGLALHAGCSVQILSLRGALLSRSPGGGRNAQPASASAR